MKGEWQDGWTGGVRDGGDESVCVCVCESECEAAVYLPNKLDRISSIIKEEREMGKTQTHTHAYTKAPLGVWSGAQHTHAAVSPICPSTYSHMYSTSACRVPPPSPPTLPPPHTLLYISLLSLFLTPPESETLCECLVVCVCVLENSESRGKAETC